MLWISLLENMAIWKIYVESDKEKRNLQQLKNVKEKNADDPLGMNETDESIDHIINKLDQVHSKLQSLAQKILDQQMTDESHT